MEKLGRKSSCRLVALQFFLRPRGGGSCSRDGQSQGGGLPVPSRPAGLLPVTTAEREYGRELAWASLGVQAEG